MFTCGLEYERRECGFLRLCSHNDLGDTDAQAVPSSDMATAIPPPLLFVSPILAAHLVNLPWCLEFLLFHPSNFPVSSSSFVILSFLFSSSLPPPADNFDYSTRSMPLVPSKMPSQLPLLR